MAAASGAQRDEMYGERVDAASEEQLLDVLYEILAHGVDPTPALSVADVERFLHEHARKRKALAELAAFFRQHGLSTDPAAYASDPELGELASGLTRERGPSSAMFLLDDPKADDPLPETPTHPAAAPQVPAEDSGVKPRAPVPAAPLRSPRVRIALVALAVGLVGAFAFSVKRGQDLERKLGEARLQQRTTDLALSALEQRAEGLRVELDQSKADRSALSRRFESFVSEEAKVRAAEEDALKRLLGPRYETLRQRGLEGAAPR